MRTCPFSTVISAFAKQVLVQFCFGALLLYPSLNAHAQTIRAPVELNIDRLKADLTKFHRSPELANEIDKIIGALPSDTPITARIDLDLWKLKALADVSNAQAAADFALQIYEQYDREEYRSEDQFGDTMQQIVQAVSKTNNIALSFEIVQELRESLYQTPSTYLNFIVDKSLMEIYIETFDYRRALEIELSILDNSDYMALDAVKAWRYSLLNEVAFLYNRLGDGDKALEYLARAREELAKSSLHPADRKKAMALNYGNRGRAYLLTGDYAQAEEMGNAVLGAGEELEQFYLVALGHRLIGSAAFHLGELDRAEFALMRGIDLAEKHNIATMQKFLYKDYALLSEERGDYETALAWQNKQFALEMQAQDAAAAARTALSNAEFNAFEASQEILKLQHENEDHEAITKRDGWIKSLLMAIVVFLLAGGAVLMNLIFSLRKGREELIKSKDEAQLANKMKSEFLANMSHEIRTPMNGVLGMAQVLQETELSDQQRQFLDTMYNSSKGLLTIINDILDFSKIEAGRLSLTPEPCDLEHLVEGVVQLMSSQAAEKDLDLYVNYEPPLAKEYLIDSVRLRQIITNLVGNAIKFTHEGHVEIRVSSQVVDNQSSVKIDVIDTGIGIAANKLNLIFDKFTQAEGSTTRRFGGTGLGLAISRKLAEAMGGQLKVTSEQGVGSVFALEVPLKEVPADIENDAPLSDDSPKFQHIEASPPAKLRTSNSRIAIQGPLKFLIASNDAAYCDTVEKYLDHPRIELTFTGNHLDALKPYDPAAFDLMLIDLSFEFEASLETLRAIRRRQAQNDGNRTPIIGTLDQSLIARKHALLAAGLDTCLPYPLQRSTLVEATVFWVKASKASAAA